MPGDGGVSLAPLYFSPPLAKEFLMLGREYTARELAQHGLINYAVPASELDATVANLVWRLLDEEKFLARNLPGYTDCQGRVRWRLIPGIF